MEEDTKKNKLFVRFARIVSWVVIVFLGAILLLNLIKTAHAWGTNGEDELVIKWQSPITVILSFAFIILVSKISPKLKKFKINSLLLMFLLYATIVAIIFYAFWNPILNADSEDLYKYIIDRNKSLTYIQTWPVNLGYLGVMLLSHVIFSDDILGLFIINLFAFYLAVISLLNISKHLFEKECVQKNLLLILACFLPLYFEIIFFYNDLLGIAFAFFGVWQALALRHNNKLRHFVLLTLAIVAMLTIRQNTLIILIAILIYLFFTTKKKNIIYTIATTLVSIIVFLFSPLVLQSAFSTIYGWDFSDKSLQDPSISWVAMGMLDQPDEELGVVPRQEIIAGWWNGYNRKCVLKLKGNCSDYSKKTIISQLKTFTSDPWRGIKFYYRKITSQWAEPSFQTPFFMSNCETPESSESRAFLCRASTHLVSFWNNLTHLAILTLCFVAVFSSHKKKKTTWRTLMPLIAVFGYFLFSILWEAKSRYILLVFPLLLPFAAYGIELIPDVLNKLKKLKGKA